MARTRTALVLGGSGSVGAALLRELLHDESFDEVVAISRRSLPEAAAVARATGRRFEEVLVADMTPTHLTTVTAETLVRLRGDVDAFSALGVGAGTAQLTLDAHRAVDVGLNQAFARALRDSGAVRHLAFLSAAGADPTANARGPGGAGMPRYNRVKGEAEEAVRAAGPAVVSVFRPGMIIGSQHTPWLLEKVLPWFSFLMPANYRSIRVDQIAKAMMATAKRRPTASATYHYPEMMSSIARGQHR